MTWNDCPICRRELVFNNKEAGAYGHYGLICNNDDYYVPREINQNIEWYLIKPYWIWRIGRIGRCKNKTIIKSELSYSKQINLSLDYLLPFAKFSSKEKIEKLLLLV